MTQCFFLEPTDMVALYLRRYCSGSNCPGPATYHNNWTRIEDAPAIRKTRDDREGLLLESRPEIIPHDDLRWPPLCECGYAFTERDEWQIFQDLIYKRSDTGETIPLREAPAGAMWYCDWMLRVGNNSHRGLDGHSLCVRVPYVGSNGVASHTEWMIDGQAKNCDLPGEEHKCWIRHGIPPNITVDKNPEPGQRTCGAGAGSIMVPGYHGFLRNGNLVEA